MTGRDHSAIRDRVEEGFSPIPGGVKTDSEPEIPRAAQSQAEEQADKRGGQHARPMLLIVFQVNESEGTRKSQCCGPEADATGERELGVSAQQKFLEESNQQEKDGPKDSKLPNTQAVQDNMPEGKGMKAGQGENKERDGSKSPQTTCPEETPNS